MRVRTVLITIPLTFLSLVALIYGVWLLSGYLRVQSRLKAIRAQGWPLTLAETQAWYEEPPKGQDAADLYEKAIGLYLANEHQWLEQLAELPVAGEKELPPLGEPLPPDMLDIMRRYVESNGEVLDLVHEAARVEKARFSIDLLAGPDTELSHLAPLRGFANLLTIDALCRAEGGDTEGALNNVVVMYRVGDSLKYEPVVISQLVRIAIHGIAKDAFVRVLQRQRPADVELIELAPAFASSEETEPMTRAIVGERAMSWGWLSGEAKTDPTDPEGRSTPEVRFGLAFYRMTGFLALDEVFMLDTFRDMVKTASVPIDQQLPLQAGVEARLDSTPKYCVLSAILLPALSRLSHATLRDAIDGRCMRTALGIERYRLAKGSLPEKLDLLVPDYLDAVPKDPYTGASLIYRQLNPGYVIYSVSADREDDGGIGLADKEKDQEWDEVDLSLRLLR